MVRAGYNISLGNLGHRYDEAMDNAASSNADFHWVMTNPHQGINDAGEIAEIQRWKDAMPSHTRLGWRTFIETNGEWVRTLGFNSLDEMLRLSEEQFRAHCKKWAERIVAQYVREGHKDVIRDDPDNEPKLAGQSEKVYRYYVISREELLKASQAKGFTVAVCAFSVGLPDSQMIERGIFDPILRIAEVFSVHEYPTAAPGLGDVIPYSAMLQPETLWVKLPKQVWGISKSYNLMRRCDKLKLRANVVGNPDLKFIISEFSTHEDIPDAAQYTNSLRGEFGKPECGGDLRGVQAWTKYDERVFGSSDANANVARMLEYELRYIYAVDYVIGVCFYSLNYRWGVHKEGEWRCHNLLNEMFDNLRRVRIPEINERIYREVDMQDETKEIPYVLPEPDDEGWSDVGEILIQPGLRVRDEPNTSGVKLIQLEHNIIGRVHADSFGKADGHAWRAIWSDEIEISGFVAEYPLADEKNLYFEWRAFPSEPEPPETAERYYQIDLPWATTYLTEFELVNLKDEIEFKIQRAQLVKTALNNAILISRE